MKTILIVIAGMADFPDALTRRETPLATAAIPSLHKLAQRGKFSAFKTIQQGISLSHKNALLSILGYELAQSEPSIQELMEFGLDNSKKISDFSTLRNFVIPSFSGHGVCITTSAWVRGVAKSAFLRPLDIYSPGSSDSEVLETIAALTTKEISQNNEFVLVYVDTPLKASLKGDYRAKVKSLEAIDRHLITPVADFVWKSDLLINMVVTTDLATSWRTRNPSDVRVPVMSYFNALDDFEDFNDSNLSFTEVEAMLTREFLSGPSDLIRSLYNFGYESGGNIEDLPF